MSIRPALLLVGSLLLLTGSLAACGSEPEATAATGTDEGLPSVDAGPPDPGAAVPSAARAQQVATLLSKADAALADRRLTTPEDDSALFYYQLAQAIDPENPVAAGGLDRIVGRYIELAEDSWKRRDVGQKDEYLARANELLPGDPELHAAMARLAAAPPAPAAGGGGGYPSIRAAKIAYRDGRIGADEYNRIERYYRVKIRDEIDRLKQMYRAGRISKGDYNQRVRAVESRYKG